MDSPVEILKKYWGYDAFRPLQAEIIQEVLEGRDILALLPTGGGKSVCFQVPSLVMPGVCIVISPLIALMKDQVEQLKKKGVRAEMVSSVNQRREIDLILDNAIYGHTKFLYVSPERLKNELFLERFKKMQVSMIAVDEAHCISQWGYDFRPAYLDIAQIRKLKPEVPIMALTATATPQVNEDIQERLAFRKKNSISRSFARDNLYYKIITTEDKTGHMIRLCRTSKGSVIVYVRSRKKVAQYTQLLLSSGVKAAGYHAGMRAEDRARVQSAWLSGESPVIVATNAFGMGIDKPDVRMVIHLEPPPDPESYFQEAGRGGRDGEPAHAVLLYHPADKKEALVRFEQNYPDAETMQRVYQCLANYYQIATGSGEGLSVDLKTQEIQTTYNLKPSVLYFGLRALEREGLIAVSDAVFQPSSIHFTASPETLYKFQVIHKNLDQFIRIILRSYGGTFESFIRINEEELAKRASLSVSQVVAKLRFLEQSGLLIYNPRNDTPKLTFLLPRQDATLVSPGPLSATLKKTALLRLNAIFGYIESADECRSNILLRYFGEEPKGPCNRCDICNASVTGISRNILAGEVQAVLKLKRSKLPELISSLDRFNEKDVIETIRWLMDEKRINKAGDYYILESED